MVVVRGDTEATLSDAAAVIKIFPREVAAHSAGGVQMRRGVKSLL
jgi:hypothetical protein